MLDEDTVLKEMPAPTLQEAIAKRYAHIPLEPKVRDELRELEMTMYRAGARAAIARNLGDAYSALMTADSMLSAALEDLAERMRSAA